MRNVAKEVTPS